MHIGLIGGIGPAATVFYYERIVAAFASIARPLHLTIGHTSALALSRNVAAGRAAEQAEEFARIARQLAAAGAQAIAVTSMGGHFCARELAAISPLPMIDGPAAVAAGLERQGIRRVGILGTRIVMQTCLYGALADLDPIAPAGDELAQVNDDYVAVAIAGAATADQAARLLRAGERLVRERGAEAVLLGGTDLNVVYDAAAVDFPVVDSAVLHVEAIVAAALADPS
ncbi:MAG: aspartate/glutamate racemase family protein [Ectothiorhodospiraceae bacterium]|nr:aspartate/glutamate racemase family protein [Chromatiales bacterium]MCP5154168.1 aspartate/glutamate racemase family protein [Ectothiorhodospiraceae bacterium]